MIWASFLTCFPQALPKVPTKGHHPFVMEIDYFSPFSAPPTPLARPHPPCPPPAPTTSSLE